MPALLSRYPLARGRRRAPEGRRCACAPGVPAGAGGAGDVSHVRRVPESAAAKTASPGREGAARQGDAQGAPARTRGGAGAAAVVGRERERHGRGGRGGAGGTAERRAAEAAASSAEGAADGVGQGGGGGGTSGAGTFSEDHQRFPLLRVIEACPLGVGPCGVPPLAGRPPQGSQLPPERGGPGAAGCRSALCALRSAGPASAMAFCTASFRDTRTAALTPVG